MHSIMCNCKIQSDKRDVLRKAISPCEIQSDTSKTRKTLRILLDKSAAYIPERRLIKRGYPPRDYLVRLS